MKWTIPCDRKWPSVETGSPPLLRGRGWQGSRPCPSTWASATHAGPRLGPRLAPTAAGLGGERGTGRPPCLLTQPQKQSGVGCRAPIRAGAQLPPPPGRPGISSWLVAVRGLWGVSQRVGALPLKRTGTSGISHLTRQSNSLETTRSNRWATRVPALQHRASHSRRPMPTWAAAPAHRMPAAVSLHTQCPRTEGPGPGLHSGFQGGPGADSGQTPGAAAERPPERAWVGRSELDLGP